MRNLMSVIKALADENRLRILGAVEGRELCVCQIVELLGLAQSTVSKHLAILHQARLVDGRKEGRWMFYRAAGEDCPRRPAKWPPRPCDCSPIARRLRKTPSG